MIPAAKTANLQRIFEKSAIPGGGNVGLVFDRYLNLWEIHSGGIRRENLFKPLEDFAAAYNAVSADDCQRMIDVVHRRLDKTVRGAVSAKFHYKARWSFVTGLGNAHPTENGFAFDHTTGLPIIPGAGIKGLCRRAALFDGAGKDDIRHCFGPESTITGTVGGPAGELIFYDAYPARKPRLKVDVVNCHHREYYSALEKEEAGSASGRPRKKDRSKPTETESPVPVFFLTIEKNAEFIFRIASRSGSERELENARRWLEFGLSVLGIGAKTAAGYGVFESVNSKSG